MSDHYRDYYPSSFEMLEASKAEARRKNEMAINTIMSELGLSRSGAVKEIKRQQVLSMCAEMYNDSLLK